MSDASTSEQCGRWSSEQLDTLFMALSDEYRRQVLQYFQTTDDDTASVQELINYTIEEGLGDKSHEHLEVTFHHITLPKLADLGMIEYDARSQTVRFYGPSVLERVLTVVTEADQPTE